jgi:flagellar hook-associated protein 3 FlgL
MSRVATATRSAQVLHDVMSIEKRLAKVTTQIASGRRINYFHDDPTSMSLTVNYEKVISEAENYQRQVNASRSWLDESDSVLQNMSESLRRAKDLSLKGANGTNDQDSLDAIAMEIDQILDETIALGNSQFDGRYLFSGQKVQTRPFSMTNNATGQTVEYLGDTNSLTRRVGPSSYIDVATQGMDIFYPKMTKDTQLSDLRAGQSIPNGTISITDKAGATANITVSSPPMSTVGDFLNAVNSSGIGVFARINGTGSGLEIMDTSAGNGSISVKDVDNVTAEKLGIATTVDGDRITGDTLYPDRSTFRTIIELRDALRAGDFDTIREKSIGELDDAINRVTNSLSQVGAKVNRLDFTEKRLSDSKFHISKLASEERDLDMAEGIMRLQEIESTQQAALAMGARLLQVSLSNYL